MHLYSVTLELFATHIWACLDCCRAQIIHGFSVRIKTPLDFYGTTWRLLLHFLEWGIVAIILNIIAHLGKNPWVLIPCLIIKGSIKDWCWALIVAHVDVTEGLINLGLPHLVSHLNTNSLRGPSVRVVMDHREPVRSR